MDNTMLNAIQNMGIFELRTFAREMGVKSPTTLKRQELINAITEISEGLKEPQVKGLTRGRKPKKIETVSTLLNKYSAEDKSYLDISYDLNKYQIPTQLKVNVPKQVFINDLSCYEGVRYRKKGVVEILNNGVGEIKLENNQKVFIPLNLMQQHAIENGQNIEVICAEIENEPNHFITTDINETCLTKCNTKFNNLESISKTKELKLNASSQPLKEFLSKNSIRAGQCILATYDQQINPEILVNDLTLSTKDLKTKKIALLSDELSNAHLKNNFMHFNTISVIDNMVVRARKIDLTLDTAKRYAEEGEDCIIIIGNLSAVYNTYRQIFIAKGNSEYVANESALQYVSAILASAKQTEKGSITIIALTQKNNDYLRNVMSLFNAYLNFVANDNKQYKLENSFSIY